MNYWINQLGYLTDNVSTSRREVMVCMNLWRRVVLTGAHFLITGSVTFETIEICNIVICCIDATMKLSLFSVHVICCSGTSVLENQWTESDFPSLYKREGQMKPRFAQLSLWELNTDTKHSEAVHRKCSLFLGNLIYFENHWAFVTLLSS